MHAKFLSPLLIVTASALAQVPGPGPGPGPNTQVKPGVTDTIRASVYADNWFMMYINGKLVAVDPIELLPHNQVNTEFLPGYPMTIAILAKDNADPKTGLEYGDHIGDAGFILKFADGTVTTGLWKAKSFFRGPLNGDIKNPQVVYEAIPADWYKADFDDSEWPLATEYAEERVKPDGSYVKADFAGAKFIWTSDLDLDNTVIFRYKVEKPGWKKRWNVEPEMDNSCLLCQPAPACKTPETNELSGSWQGRR